LIITANLDHLRRYEHEPAYRDIVDTAALVLADGMPIVWAASIRGTPLPERVAGSTMLRPLCAAAALAGRSVFFLGGNPGVAAHAADLLRHESPDLRIAGVACPPPGFERDEAELDRLLQDLRQARPEIVLVALGSPKQEFIARRLSKSVPPAVWIGVGISFSFLTGDVARAPRWMQRLGLEWLHRLAQEPRRLFQRYILQGVPFASRLLIESLLRRAAAGSPPGAEARKQ
jgi:N-acetylglucosaminyldiphosphoundecaprenol N-acetyl-beta-D-mannosaminyltransferase